MKKYLDYIAAWEDFWLWIKSNEEVWKQIPRKGKYGKLYLYKTKANIEKRADPGRPIVGPMNVYNILHHHAPERYKMEAHFILIGRPMKPIPNKKAPLD